MTGIIFKNNSQQLQNGRFKMPYRIIKKAFPALPGRLKKNISLIAFNAVSISATKQ